MMDNICEYRVAFEIENVLINSDGAATSLSPLSSLL